MRRKGFIMSNARNPQKISTYFLNEWKILFLVTVTGLIYNCGILAGPWLEGLMAECLVQLVGGNAVFTDMLQLSAAYLVLLSIVQLARFIKRLYVRRFANEISRSMKTNLYANLLHMEKAQLSAADAGTILTKAISDVDACAEGMRKFTTEIFDTGVALLSYAWMLLHYDLRLALLCLIFPPISYALAEHMKTLVQRTGAASKESAGRLSAATMDRVSGAITYRVHGMEQQRNNDYEAHLADYQEKAVLANIWVQVMPPLYQMISMLGILFILYYGSRNVLGTGWSAWSIAAFTTFLSCYMKLCVKSSHAAKLFNAVHKAQVSWKRIQPLLSDVTDVSQVPRIERLDELRSAITNPCDPNRVLTLTQPAFKASAGQIIGITGPVACGKSTFGRAFLCESEFPGSITFAGYELSSLPPVVRSGIIGYLGHDSELLSDTIEANILMGDAIDPMPFVHAVCLDEDLASMPLGLQTRIGDSGIRLSGGQQKRVALARTLAHARPVLVLDDPFSALDRRTEEQIFQNLQEMIREKGLIVLLISHRLTLFPQMDQVIWMERLLPTESSTTETSATENSPGPNTNATFGGSLFTVSTHQELCRSCPHYNELYSLQKAQGMAAEDHFEARATPGDIPQAVHSGKGGDLL